MGGKAFTNHDPPINIVRIPDDLYTKLRDHFISVLKGSFARVDSPIEGPGKVDHGDMDILVSGAKLNADGSLATSVGEFGSALDSFLDNDEEAQAQPAKIERFSKQLKSLLGAEAYHHLRPCLSFAIPFPLEPDTESTKRWIQLDITRIPALPPSLFTWHLLLNSYGDLWSILSMSLRRVGLVASASGFSLVSPVLERTLRTGARLLLTLEVDEVLSFLGLGNLVIARPEDSRDDGQGINNNGRHVLKTPEELYLYISRCRFFDIQAYKYTCKTANEDDQYVDKQSEIAPHDYTEKNQKHVNKRTDRPIFRGFLDDWLPALVEAQERLSQESRVCLEAENISETGAMDVCSDVDDDLKDESRLQRSTDLSLRGQILGNKERNRIDNIALPSNPSNRVAQFPSLSRPPPRHEVAVEALTRFGKHAEWAQMHEAYEQEQRDLLERKWSKGMRMERLMLWEGLTKGWLDVLGIKEFRGKGEEKGTWKYVYGNGVA